MNRWGLLWYVELEFFQFHLWLLPPLPSPTFSFRSKPLSLSGKNNQCLLKSKSMILLKTLFESQRSRSNVDWKIYHVVDMMSTVSKMETVYPQGWKQLEIHQENWLGQEEWVGSTNILFGRSKIWPGKEFTGPKPFGPEALLGYCIFKALFIHQTVCCRRLVVFF